MKQNSDPASMRTPATVFAVDSIEENRLGIGRTFSPNKRIGKREIIVSSHLLKQLDVAVGEKLTLMYDIKLILSMAQRLSGEILPSILTKKLSMDELIDDERRSVLAWELSEFFCNGFEFDLDENGVIQFDFKDELQSALDSDEPTNFYTKLLEGSQEIIKGIKISESTLAELTSDQEIAELLLENNITNLSIDLV